MQQRPSIQRTPAANPHKTISVVFGCGVLFAFASVALSQPLAVHTLAGRPLPGSADGFGSNARFIHPTGLATDPQGSLYVADPGNGTIRRIGRDGLVITFAGSAGNFGTSNGIGTNALFSGPQGLAVDAESNIYVADTGNGTIRKITPSGNVSTFAGSAGSFNSFDGQGALARFYQPEAVAVDTAGTIYVADAWNHTVRKVTAQGEVTTLAGLAGHSGSADGTNSRARFHRPSGIAVDGATNLFVADSLNHTIRRITPEGTVSTIAGLPGVWGNTDGTNNAARFFQPQGIVAVGEGQFIVSDTANHSLRMIVSSGTNWIVSTLAGTSGNPGHAEGAGELAQFNFPIALARDSAGDLYIADSGNHTIRTTRVVPPTLQFKTTERQLILSWPTSSPGFLLETSPALGAGEAWTATTNGIYDLGDNFAVTNTQSPVSTFYRLQRP